MLFCVAVRFFSKVSIDFLTAPRRRSVSADFCWIASVRKPICRLFKSAASVEGPAKRILCSFCRVYAKSSAASMAYMPSEGRKSTAKSVV